MFGALLCGITYWSSRASREKDWHYWGVLALLFLFLSLDENIQFHEKIAEHLTPALPTDLNGFIHWSWVVPYSVLIVAAGLFFISFVLRLPMLTRRLFLISGLVFVTGAFGLELLEGYFFKLYGLDHIINKLLYCIEELLEMWAVILFLYALLDYMNAKRIQLSFGRELHQPQL
ncbi:hypothetical protein ADICEAN_03354 [Cesiribacter andamanensis AMV16]|uniref:Uncharacterized protein n=2 Tax=Cesiribacter TaxID=1133570 RepID=M7MYI7_9BACT|nr:hypothetical protein ADICEAN_03354 [Cesiribacter andamanensis AMV16]